MNRIATMSVIRGEGQVEAIMNGVVQKELQRLQELSRKQLDEERIALRMEMNYLRAESDTIRASRNKMLGQKLIELEDELSNISTFARIIDGLQTAWGITYGTVSCMLSSLRRNHR